MLLNEILIVRQNGDLYGINTENIESILRVLDITPVPYSPIEVRGFCSIEGRIMTVLDISRMILKDVEIDTSKDEVRLISVQMQNQSYAVLFEEVINNLTLDQNALEIIGEDRKREDGVCAIYQHGEEIIQILDLEAIIADIVKLTFKPKHVSAKIVDNAKSTKTEGRISRFFLFVMGSEEYAIDVLKIREVISVPETITEIADSPDEVIGMMTLRDEFIVVVDLRKVYSLPAHRDESNRIIVVQNDEKTLGFLIDSILDIVDLSTEDIDAMPSNFVDDKISGVVRIKDTLISIMNPAAVNTIIERESIANKSKEVMQEESTNEDETIEIVSFRLGEENFAVYTNEVIEIIDSFEITSVPDMPTIVDGVTNIRGQVVPAVKLYNKLSLVDSENEDSKMIVCTLNNASIGIVVDKVMDVRHIDISKIEPEQESPYFTDIIKDNDEMILILNLEELLDVG